MSWSDNRRVSTDVGWYMPYFTTAEYGWQVREPIHDMLIRIIDNTYDPELMPDFRDDIHFIADQMMAPDRKVDGKDGRYVSTMKKYLVSAFNMLDISRAQWEYVAPGGTPYPFDESCEDEIISIWEATDPTIVREQAYKAFMKLAYGDWINYDKKHTAIDSPKTVVASSFTKVTVHGTENGLGTMVSGINYLQPRLEAIPNGAAGSWLSNTAWIADSLDQGYTFNTGEATIIIIEFKHAGDANILPAHIGNLMLVEGSTMPTQYDETTNLFKGTITNGCIAVSTYLNNSGNFEVGKTQYLYAGEGEDGISHLYYVLQSRIPQRCKTFAIPVKKNTQYCVKSFNSAYTDIKISLGFLTAPGTITPTVTSCSPLPQKSIPGNETFNANTEQWINLVSSHWRNTSHFQVAVDARPLLYKYCESFATLKAGTYKVMCDVWGNNRFSGSGGWWTGISQYRGNVNDNFDDTGASTNEWFALIAEDNTQIIQKTEIIPTGTTRNQPISYGAPYPNYWHKEVTFTLTTDTKVGLMHSAYYSSNSDPNYAYFRFMIVDSDVEAVEFTTTNADPCDMTGYSAWEKYQMVVSVNVQFTDVVAGTSTTLTKTVPSLLYSNDSVDFTQDLPTYSLDDSYGIVTVEVLDKDQEDPTIVPTIDINYH